jgi:hypothetical protein
MAGKSAITPPFGGEETPDPYITTVRDTREELLLNIDFTQTGNPADDFLFEVGAD